MANQHLYLAAMQNFAPPSYATITPAPNFNAVADAQALRAAMKGFGTDEAAIIKILTSRSAAQRLEIVQAYTHVVRRDLIKDLKDELSGDFEKGVLTLVKHPAVRDAEYLHNAMKGIGTDEHVLREILCSRSGAELKQICAAYFDLYKKDLKDQIAKETSGDFKKVLVALASGSRPEGPADPGLVRQDIDALYKAGAGTWGTDEDVFISLLTNRSPDHLRAVFAAYNDVYHTDLISVLKSEMSGDLLKALLIIITCLRAPEEYFADEAYRAMKGFGTDEDTLTRVIMTRADVDLQKVKLAYNYKYEKALDKAVASEVSGDYKKLLLAALA